jgi:hypothetical protein
VSGLHHVELRPRSLRYHTTESPQRLCRKQTLIDRYGADIRLPDLGEQIAQCRHCGMHDACMVRYVDLLLSVSFQRGCDTRQH